MNIKIKKKTWEEAMALPRPKHKKPIRPNFFFRSLVRVLSQFDADVIRFDYSFPDKKTLPEGPYLILMNHSSFLDLKLASKILYPMPYQIVCTSDAMMGLEWLMRRIGCIPTAKFVSDMTLLKDMKYALQKKKTSVLMYPEAGYSFDGRSVRLPDNLGSLCKVLKVPVIMITTHGAFLQKPLFAQLKKRKVKVSADVKLLLTSEDVKEKTPHELDAIVKEAFSFDGFRWQAENRVKIDEPDRAEGLEKILYKCCHCRAEGSMESEGAILRCKACGREYYLDEYGTLEAKEGDTPFSHIPDWYAWEGECAKEDVENGGYHLESDTHIMMAVDYKAIYDIGNGRLVHDENGFHLYDADGKLLYEHAPLTSHSVCADFYWYEKGDVIGIGTKDMTYYCLLNDAFKVAKMRHAAEALYQKLRPRTEK
ncbi:MAG: 1-acyl-sn-glycerol-3-phosphate acyltransferase [Clostridia bacterium]|nr:1-acyl-sn-glycerol-3-phosphate acyltransferase [Clostridia bacterium]